jgi:hypothetical protein
MLTAACHPTPFNTYMPNVPKTSGPLTPYKHCDQPDGANVYLHLTVTSTTQIIKVRGGLKFTRRGEWVPAHNVEIKLVKLQGGEALLSWHSTDGVNVSWLYATYQVQPGGQINTLMTSRDHPYQLVVHPGVGQQYVVYGDFKGAMAHKYGCAAVDASHPIIDP